MPLCLSAGAVAATLAIQAFTLAWTHSIEKVRWEEDWRIENRQLAIVEARIRGSGAGMEPPADAVLRDGVWHYRPTIAPLPRLILTNSPFATGYELCVNGACRPLLDHLPGVQLRTGDSSVIVVAPCPERQSAPPETSG